VTGSIQCSDGAFGVFVPTPYQNFCDYSSALASTTAPVAATTATTATAPATTATARTTTTGTAGPRVTSFKASGPINATNGQVISGLKITNPNGPCVTVANVSNVRIVDSEIGPCGGGSADYGNANIKIIGASNITVEYSNVFGGNRPFIAQGGSNITFQNNLTPGPFSGGGLTGGIEFDQVNGGTVDGNVISGEFPGDVISMFESSNMRVTNNLLNVSIRDPSGAGFTMGDSTTGNPGHDNYVAFNTVTQTGGVPAGVFGSTANTVLEKNCLKSGIQAYNYSGTFNGVTVRSNVINMGASYVPVTSVISGWSTNINSTDCRLVP
jgi:hypothetical protein